MAIGNPVAIFRHSLFTHARPRAGICYKKDKTFKKEKNFLS